MARTFQHVKMIPDMTVLENVAMGAYTRGHSGVIGSMLRINKSEEQRMMKRLSASLSASAWASTCTSRPATWPWARNG